MGKRLLCLLLLLLLYLLYLGLLLHMRGDLRRVVLLLLLLLLWVDGREGRSLREMMLMVGHGKAVCWEAGLLLPSDDWHSRLQADGVGGVGDGYGAGHEGRGHDGERRCGDLAHGYCRRRRWTAGGERTAGHVPSQWLERWLSVALQARIFE